MRRLRELRRVLRDDGQIWIYDARITLRRATTAARRAFPDADLRREIIYTGRFRLSLFGRLTIKYRTDSADTDRIPDVSLRVTDKEKAGACPCHAGTVRGDQRIRRQARPRGCRRDVNAGGGEFIRSGHPQQLIEFDALDGDAASSKRAAASGRAATSTTRWPARRSRCGCA